MMSLPQCAAIAGLSSHEMILGVTPSARHEALLRSYASITSLSKAALCGLIVTDLRNFLDLGAVRQAGDRFIVLRQLLSEDQDPRPAISSSERAEPIRTRGVRGWRPQSHSGLNPRPTIADAAA
jgi:hypothetical protein